MIISADFIIYANFIKDAEKGYNIITKYYENNKNDSLSQNILGFLHFIKSEPLKGFGYKDNNKKAFDYGLKNTIFYLGAFG